VHFLNQIHPFQVLYFLPLASGAGSSLASRMSEFGTNCAKTDKIVFCPLRIASI
jgi:hypothetical protein